MYVGRGVIKTLGTAEGTLESSIHNISDRWLFLGYGEHGMHRKNLHKGEKMTPTLLQYLQHLANCGVTYKY